jgi:hypothetical protein
MFQDAEITIILWVLGGLLCVIAALLAWGVHQMQNQVAEISERLSQINRTLGGIERDLRGELAGLDRRVSQLYTAVRSLHPDYHGLDGQ